MVARERDEVVGQAGGLGDLLDVRLLECLEELDQGVVGMAQQEQTEL